MAFATDRTGNDTAAPPERPAPTAARRRARLAGPVAALLTAVLVRYGTGLDTVPALTWAAALPMLAVAPGLRARSTWAWAFAGWAAGMANLAPYALGELSTPVVMVVGLIGLEAALFAGVVVLFRALAVRGRWGWAATAVPAAAVAADFLVSRSNPHGTFLSLAYTQADTPLLPMAAITGGWGIVALLYAVPAAVAVLGRQLRDGVPPRAGGVALAVALAAAVALPAGGTAVTGPGGRAVRVAAVAVPVPEDQPQLDSAAGRAVVAAMADGIRQAAARGAEVAVLGEASLLAGQEQLPALVSTLREAAGPGLAVSLGVVVDDGRGGLTNQQVVIAPGRAPVAYAKQHLVPGQESGEITPGDRTVTASHAGVRWGLLICKDLDFPWTARAAAADARGLLVPAWDFRVDGWLHGRMALVRGAENGMPMIRSARSGRLTISTVHGDVVAEGDTVATPGQVVDATVRLGDRTTPYTRLGDWLAYLALAVTAAAGAACRRRPPLARAAFPPGPRAEQRHPATKDC